jgi:hypothetical protein
MKTMGIAARMLGIVLLAAAAGAGTGAGLAVGNDVDPAVLSVREAAWRAYFAGDEKTLQALLPAEFIGISMNDVPISDLATTLEGAREFKRKGGRLVRLAFPETRSQRFGDVVVLYGRYEVVIFSDGAESTMSGRLTEMFVRRDGKWVHPGWHLDLSGKQASQQ